MAEKKGGSGDTDRFVGDGEDDFVLVDDEEPAEEEE